MRELLSCSQITPYCRTEVKGPVASASSGSSSPSVRAPIPITGSGSVVKKRLPARRRITSSEQVMIPTRIHRCRVVWRPVYGLSELRRVVRFHYLAAICPSISWLNYSLPQKQKILLCPWRPSAATSRLMMAEASPPASERRSEPVLAGPITSVRQCHYRIQSRPS